MLLTRSEEIDHPQGKEQLMHQDCGVTFDIIIPNNLVATPYYLFTSLGEHIHPPPPPHKTPTELKDEIVRLVKRMQDPSLTTG